MKTIRVLKAGLSGSGGGNAKLAYETKGMAVVGGVDVVPRIRKAFESDYGCPSFAAFEEGLRAVEADAAVISTPDPFHAPYAIAAMKAGLDVLVEKPMATAMREAKRMHKVAEETGRILMVKQNLRWLPVHMAARSYLRKVGQIRQIDFDCYVNNPGVLKGYRAKIPYLLLQDLGIHHLDLLRFLTGKNASTIYTVTWPSVGKPSGRSATAARAIIEMEGPITVSYRGEMLSITDSTGYGCRYSITGTKGALSVRDGKLLIRDRAAVDRGEPAQEVSEAEVPRLCRETFMDAFGRAVRTRKQPMTHSGDNLFSLAMVFTAMRSAETGRVERVRP